MVVVVVVALFHPPQAPRVGTTTRAPLIPDWSTWTVERASASLMMPMPLVLPLHYVRLSRELVRLSTPPRWRLLVGLPTTRLLRSIVGVLLDQSVRSAKRHQQKHPCHPRRDKGFSVPLQLYPSRRLSHRQYPCRPSRISSRRRSRSVISPVLHGLHVDLVPSMLQPLLPCPPPHSTHPTGFSSRHRKTSRSSILSTASSVATSRSSAPPRQILPPPPPVGRTESSSVRSESVASIAPICLPETASSVPPVILPTYQASTTQCPT
mmetsp:Transcript_10357/g.20810  ORF Transcript_10357/g.20810 Transcript_10357/m.20810 type:complete len:265 (+) Transcript_10357:1274-2068(+)